MPFQLAPRFSDGEQVLTAHEYFEGHLDWYAFDANREVTLGGTDQAFDSDHAHRHSRSRQFSRHAGGAVLGI